MGLYSSQSSMKDEVKSTMSKPISYIIPLIIIISFSFLFFSLHRFNSLLEQKLSEFGFSASEYLTHSCKLGVLSEDETLLDAPVRGIFNSKDVVAITIYNRKGRIIVSKKKVELEEGIPRDAVVEILSKKNHLKRTYYTADGEKIYNFFAPIFSNGVLVPKSKHDLQRVIGFIRVGLSLKRIKQQLKTIFLITLIVGILMIFLGAFGVQLLYKRKQAERALRISEEKYRLVIENASEGIIVIQKGMLKFVNPKMIELSGYSEEELTSKFFTNYIHPKDRKMVLQNLLQEVKGEDIPQSVFKAINKNGDVMWLEAKGVVILWEGRPATLTFLTDISQRKKMEEEFFKTQKLESVGILAGGIAHDFNNILSGILGNISLAKLQETHRDKLYKFLENAEKATTRAQALTKQLLTFSKGGSPVKKTTSISEVIKESSEFALRGSKVGCDFRVPDDLWPVEVDVGQFNQVIQNLIMNADQAMPEGGNIEIWAENFYIKRSHILPLPIGRYVKISIRDHGIGIPKEHLQKVFDPYFTTKEQGSGLGLTTSYLIMRKHGGYITVDSELNKGTTFHIYIPASTREISPKMEDQQKLFKGKGRVLFMDDEQMIRDLACQMIRYLGYEVECVADGEEVIKLYSRVDKSKKAFDVVIMDLTVPGKMGGKKAIQKLKEIDPEVRAIVSSGYYNDPIMSNFKEYGFKGVVVKPYKIEELSKVLHEVLKT